MAATLQEIERAQKTAAEGRLAAARKQADRAEEGVRTARIDAEQAERQWAEQLSAGRFNVELQVALSAELLRKEQELEAREQQQSDAEAKFDRHRRDWQQLEAGVRAGADVLKRGRRFLSGRTVKAHDQALSERTTWEWFRR
jgi:hypothetical protein